MNMPSIRNPKMPGETDRGAPSRAAVMRERQRARGDGGLAVVRHEATGRQKGR